MGIFGSKKSKENVTVRLKGFPADLSTNKCLLMAAEKDIRLESELLDITEGACDGPEYRQLSPFGKLPCLREGGFLTSGAPAILAYLDIRGQGGSLNPKKASILGEQNYLIDLARRFLDNNVDLLIQSFLPQGQDSSSKSNENTVEAARGEISSALDCAEAALADGRRFLVGEYSFADIHWTACIHLCVMAGHQDLLDGKGSVKAWFDRVQHRISKVGGKRTFDYLASLDEIRNKRLKSVA
ncbi:MAG: glutathione S-transferase family protein [Candidatus Thiodiazotropha sp.]